MIDLSTSSDGEAALRAARECLAMEIYQCFDSSMVQRDDIHSHTVVFLGFAVFAIFAPIILCKTIHR